MKLHVLLGIFVNGVQYKNNRISFLLYYLIRHLNVLIQVEKTISVLKKRNIAVGEGVRSTTYVRVKPESEYHEGNALNL